MLPVWFQGKLDWPAEHEPPAYVIEELQEVARVVAETASMPVRPISSQFSESNHGSSVVAPTANASRSPPAAPKGIEQASQSLDSGTVSRIRAYS